MLIFALAMNKLKKYKVIGLMSGTSLDGVDVLACEFSLAKRDWEYAIIQGETFSYPNDILERLKSSQNLSGLKLAQLNTDYGNYLGELVNTFINNYNYKPELIASHGYTVFHEPQKGLTLQIGSGAEIASKTEIKTICDFRTNDVALGGQGAPLVPIGDELLFSKYIACLNLGGFSNISYNNEENSRVAFDICAVNFVLNHLVQKLGLNYDKEGKFGQSGKVIDELLLQLNELGYYKQEPPKSLGREFVESVIFPIFEDKYSTVDIMATFYEHVALQLSAVIDTLPMGQILITGGGAFNTYLINLLRSKCSHDLIVSDKQLIEFKEALIFGFLGVLRELEIPNCLASVTGALKDNIGGCVYI